MGKSTPSPAPHSLGLGTLEVMFRDPIIPAYVHSRSQSPVHAGRVGQGRLNVLSCVHMSVSLELLFLLERKVTKESWPRGRFSGQDVACGWKKQLTSISPPPEVNLSCPPALDSLQSLKLSPRYRL